MVVGAVGRDPIADRDRGDRSHEGYLRISDQFHVTF